MILKIGQVLNLQTSVRPNIGEGVYILLSPPTGPLVRLCLAGEDETGDVCRTEEIVEVAPGDLRFFEPIPTLPLIDT